MPRWDLQCRDLERAGREQSCRSVLVSIIICRMNSATLEKKNQFKIHCILQPVSPPPRVIPLAESWLPGHDTESRAGPGRQGRGR